VRLLCDDAHPGKVVRALFASLSGESDVFPQEFADVEGDPLLVILDL
jgi:hypothetical protein